MAKSTEAMDKAIAAWPSPIPEWIEALASACDHAGRAAVARDIGYSESLISQVLGNKYPADTGRIRQAIKGALLHVEVNCPVLGEIPGQLCVEKQRLPFAATNPSRVRLYTACRNGCAHARQKTED